MNHIANQLTQQPTKHQAISQFITHIIQPNYITSICTLQIRNNLKMERQQKKVYLDINHVFGSNFAFPMKNQIGLIEQQQKIKLVYAAGKTVIKKCLQSNQMEFIRLSDNIENIECMAISPTRNHISVCEKIKNQNFLLLNLYGLKTRDSEIKHFKLPQTQKQSSFKLIAFSPSQPKYLCCMTSEPHNQLMFLDISRSRGLAVSNFTVEGAESLMICPTQSHLISCAGKNIFKLFKVEDYSFKAYEDVKKLPKTRNFTAHAWFDKTKILIGTDRGQLFMVGPVGNNFQVKRQFNNVFGIQSTNNDVGVSSICVFSKGFILGSTKGHFSLWVKKQQDEQNFQDEYTGELVKKWRMSQGKCSEVSSIAMCPKEHHVAVSFRNNSIALTTMDVLMNADEMDENSVNLSDEVMNLLYDGFHVNSVDCMDVCMHRPLIATMSKRENTVRIWNYKNPNCQMTKRFDSKQDGMEELGTSQLINCLAFHPLGYYMAIGCCDKLRFYHILQSAIRNYRQIVLRGVIQLKFSNGGHMLAAAYPRQKHNIHQINVYNSYTLEEIARLSDHSNLITELCWKFDDKFLYSVGVDGTVAEWKVSESRECKEWVCKKWNQNNSKYSSVIFEKNAKSFLAGGFESNKSVIREFKTQKDQAQKIYNMGFKITRMQYLTSQWNVSAVLVGTQDGSIKIFNSQFDNIVEQTINCHMKEITAILASPCGRYVFTASKDGLIFIYQVSLTNREGFIANNKRLHEQAADYELNPLVGVLDEELADIVLVQRNDINEKIRYTKLLQKNLEDMKRKLVMQDDDENRKHQLQIKGVSQEKQQVIDELTLQLQQLKKQKKQLQSFFQTNFVNTQVKNEKMMQDIESLYEKKLAIENKKYFQLERQYEAEQKRQQEQIRQLKQKTTNTIDLLKKQFGDCFKKAEKVHVNQLDNLVMSEKTFSEKVNQIEEQHENELKKISQSIAEIENQKTKKSAEYANTIESLKRDCRLLNEEIVQYMSDNQHVRQVTKQLKYELDSVNDTISRKKKQLEDKQQNLKARQQKLGCFQDKISQLQKKKQVLSYRTWQMRQQIQPKQDEIDFLKQQIFSLQSEFQLLLNEQKTIKSLQQKIKRQKQQLHTQTIQQKTFTKQKKAKFKKICDDISQIVNRKISDKKLYEKQMQKLWEKYGNLLTQSKKNNNNLKGIQEMNRHMEHLDNQIDQVNAKTDATLKRRDVQIQKATQENADLLKELTMLRQEKQTLSDQLRNLQKISQTLKRQNSQLKTLAETNKEDPMAVSTTMKKTNGLKVGGTGSGSTPTSHLIRSASQPLHKGKLVKGINYDTESLSIFSKAKIKELEGKLQMVKLTYRKKQKAAKLLRQKILEHLKKECDDSLLEKNIIDYEF